MKVTVRNILISFIWHFNVTFGIDESYSYSYSSYDYEMVECPDIEAHVNRDSIQVHHEVSRSYEPSGSKHTWKLMYNITWSPPDQEHNYTYKVQVQQRSSEFPSLTIWTFFDCKDFPEKATDVTEPFFVTEALFTSESLFQVAPIYEDSLTTSFGSHITFETPDCYWSTNDLDFCTTQSVLLSGAPVELFLTEVIKYATNGSIVPSFQWCDPIQVNSASTIEIYILEIETETGEPLISGMVRHTSNVDTYTWTAYGSTADIGIIQEGLRYKVKVTPFLSTDGQGSELLMGYSSELWFWTDVTKVVYDESSSLESRTSDGKSG